MGYEIVFGGGEADGDRPVVGECDTFAGGHARRFAGGAAGLVGAPALPVGGAVAIVGGGEVGEGTADGDVLECVALAEVADEAEAQLQRERAGCALPAVELGGGFEIGLGGGGDAESVAQQAIRGPRPEEEPEAGGGGDDRDADEEQVV